MKISVIIIVVQLVFLASFPSFAGISCSRPDTTEVLESDTRIASFYNRIESTPVDVIASDVKETFPDQIIDPESRVHPFDLSSTSPFRMNYADALAYCARMDSDLPTQEQMDALMRAISQKGIYQLDFIATIKAARLWVLSRSPDSTIYGAYFNGPRSKIGIDRKFTGLFVRCVRDATRG